MNRTICLPLLLAATLGLASAQAPSTNSACPAPTSAPPVAAADNSVPPVTTAILDFQVSDADLNKEAGELATLLEAQMSASRHATLVERANVEKILSEQELGASGLVSADSAAKIGSLTGAEVLVTGRLFAVGDQYMVVAKIISAETSRVYGLTVTLPKLDQLSQGAQELAGKIDGVLASHRDVLVVKEETPDQRLQRLKALIGNHSLPTVSVNISERDYSQPSIDPAAQTEMLHDLQQLGFRVLAPGTDDKRADVRITGEAFSETGVHHGNLVSSRGRVEIKASRSDSRQLLWVDRETRVAVDVGDRSAGKAAIEKAARLLLERMLPQLIK